MYGYRGKRRHDGVKVFPVTLWILCLPHRVALAVLGCIDICRITIHSLFKSIILGDNR